MVPWMCQLFLVSLGMKSEENDLVGYVQRLKDLIEDSNFALDIAFVTTRKWFLIKEKSLLRLGYFGLFFKMQVILFRKHDSCI